MDRGSGNAAAAVGPVGARASRRGSIAAAGAGWGKLDDAAVVKVYEAAGDFKVSSPVK